MLNKRGSRAHTSGAVRPASHALCIVMVCADLSEADQVSRQLSELNTGCLVTYRRVEDLTLNAPTGKVALVILSAQDDPVVMARTLRWLRHRWPRCSVTVVGDAGSTEQELVAREGGAYFLARPVVPEQWAALLGHVLGKGLEITQEDRFDV